MTYTEITREMVNSFVPTRRSDSHKGDNGRVLVVGGSRIYHGAPALAAMAALRTGTDLAYVAVPNVIVGAVRAASCDIIVIPMADQKLTRGTAIQLAGSIPKRIDCAAIGMGLSSTDGLGILLDRLTDMDIRLVLDAGALVPSVLEHVRGKNCILTPHTGEFHRVFGETPPADITIRTKMVAAVAAKYDTTILLKGQIDTISDGSHTFVSTGDVPAMTAGGTGDVLCGIVAGILARNRRSVEAAAAAAYINKHAGALIQKCLGHHMVASDLISKIPCAMNDVS